VTLLADRSVVVTGAGSGIGRAIALLFAREGARVVCADLRRPWVDDTVQMIEAEGGTAVASTCDVTRADEVAGAVASAVESFGRLDVMCNNAGIASPRPGMLLEDHTSEDFDRLFAVNARGAFHGCKEAVLQFKRQGGGGVIVNTGSVAGMIAWGGVPYGATKALVIQLTRALAIEAAPHRIRVNCFCPGGIRTNLGRDESEAFQEPGEDELGYLRTLHPLGEIITPEDCARAALFLASDMSANITGVALPVDGGYIAK
jgi:NAD(P)-dependent dehydrogenase (short-subunit alcohol dehydrogenase family)